MLFNFISSLSTTAYPFLMHLQGKENLDLITTINYNATSAHTRLRQDFDAVQQTLMLCTLDAQVAYIGSMRLANEELQECRRDVAAMEAR